MMARTKDEITKTFGKLEGALSSYGLNIHKNKTKHMEIVLNGTGELVTITIKGRDKIQKFEYLGVTLSSKREEEADNDMRTTKGYNAASKFIQHC